MNSAIIIDGKQESIAYSDINGHERAYFVKSYDHAREAIPGHTVR